MNMAEASRRERYDEEWNGWKAEAAAFAGVRRYDQISRVIHRLGARTMLDIGCGDGRLAGAIKRKNPAAIVHGCDFSTAALARSAGLDRQYAVDLNVERLPEPDDRFDLVVASEVIEHLIHPDLALVELRRVLRPGGHVVVTVPNVAFWRFRLQALCGDVPSVTADERHLHSFNASLLQQLVRKAGFDVVRTAGLRQRFETLSRVRFTLLCDTLLIVGRKP